MKSLFSKLSVLLLCGAVAFVGCTDFDEDIKAVDQKIDNLTSTTDADLTDLETSISELEAQLAAQYATKEEVANVKKALEESISGEVAELNTQIEAVSDALDAAEKEIDEAISDLESKKADKTAVDAAIAEATTAITNLQSKLDDTKDALEKQIATVQGEVDAVEGEVDALQTYVNNLEATVNAIDAELTKLAEETLPAMQATLEGMIGDVDAKADANAEALAALAQEFSDYKAEHALKVTEIEGSIAALDAYVKAYEKETDAAIEKLQNDLASLSDYLDETIESLKAEDATLAAGITELNDLLEKEVEAREAADEALAEKLSQEIADKAKELDALIAAEVEARKEADEALSTELYSEITSLKDQIAQVYNALSLEIGDVKTELAAHIEAFDAYKEVVDGKLADLEDADEALAADLESKSAALQQSIDDLKAEDTAIKQSITDLTAALDAQKTALTEAIATAKSEAIAAAAADTKAKYDAAIQAVNDLETRLTKKIDDAISAVKVDVDKLLAQVQSLVYVPEYNDHKATIEYAKVSGYSVSVPVISELRYSVNSNSVTAADLALAYAADNSILSFDTKEVKVRTRSTEAAPELQIVGVHADEEGYLCVDVLPKNFVADFYKDNASYSAALVLVQEDKANNISSEYTNLIAASKAKFNATLRVYQYEGEWNALTGYTDYQTVSGGMTIERNPAVRYIASSDFETVVSTYKNRAGLAVDGKFYPSESIYEELGIDVTINHAKRLISYDKDGNRAYPNITIQGASWDDTIILYDRGNYNVVDGEDDSHLVNLKEVADAEQVARVGGYLMVENTYSIGDAHLDYPEKIQIAKKFVKYDIPAITVPWTMGLADSLSLMTTERILYAAPLERNAAYENPASFAGYDLYSILQTGTTLERYVSCNGATTTAVDIQAHIEDDFVTLTLSNQTDNPAEGYAFPEYDAENEKYNEYTITWVKEHETMTAEVTATIKLGEKPASFSIDMTPEEPVTLSLVGTNPYYSATVEFVDAAYAEFAQAGLLGYEKEADGKAAFYTAFGVADPSATAPNTVTVNGEAGTYNNVSYANSLIRLYNNNTIVEGVQEYVSEVKNLWFEVPFTFSVDATIDEPANELLYSTLDFVKFNEDGNAVVKVDGAIADGIYTIDQADLAKYFNVSNDADNANTLNVSFEVKTEGAPDPQTSVVGVVAGEGVDYSVPVYGQAVITDWTNGGTFMNNEITVEAVLTANGFVLDTKTVVLYTADPLTFTKSDIRVKREPGKPAVAKTYSGLSLTSIVEKGNLINTSGASSENIFDKSKANTTYGATFGVTPTFVRVYVIENGEEVAYPRNKFTYENGVVTLLADDGVLNNSIYAEVVYSFTHNFNYGETQTEKVIVEFYPAE